MVTKTGTYVMTIAHKWDVHVPNALRQASTDDKLTTVHKIIV
jgi:hypothetical protein